VLNITRPGTSSAYITYKAENPGGAVIDGRNNSTKFGILVMQSAAYIKIEGFEIKGFSYFGIEGYGSHDVIIKNNHIHDIGRYTVSNCSDAYGRAGVYTTTLTSNYTFEGNTIGDTGRLLNSCEENVIGHDHGLYLQGKYMTIKNNTFYSNTGGYAIKVDGYYGAEVGAAEKSHVISGNIFQPLVTTHKLGGGFITFWNNKTYSATYGYMKPPKNVLVENNTFYKPDGIQYKSAIIIKDSNYSNFKGTVLKNNKTSSKYLYCEYLGSVVTKNVTAPNNTVNAYDSIFTLAKRG